MAKKFKLRKVEGLKALTALSDIFNGFILNVLLVVSDDNKKEARVAVAFFIFFGGAQFVANLVYIAFAYKREEEGTLSAWDIVVLIIYMIGLMLYFYGDNIMLLIDEYGEDLGTGCGTKCRDNIIASGKIALAVAALITVPKPLNKLWKWEKDESSEPDSVVIYVCQMLAYLVDFDAIYSLLFAGEDCSLKVYQIVAWIAFALFCLAFPVVVFGSTIKKIQNSATSTDCVNVSSFILCVFVVAACCCHLLADNLLPLDCIGRGSKQYIIRLVFSIVALFSASLVSFVWFCASCTATEESETVALTSIDQSLNTE